ncbi:hypothetical protein LBMAG38_22680 [Chloroflexota bacterium]|nr:hypothetical protein LBMAG38_22680 [Chloroflexota bacterium]
MGVRTRVPDRGLKEGRALIMAIPTGLAPIHRTVMGLGADGADGWEASKATGLREPL